VRRRTRYLIKLLPILLLALAGFCYWLLATAGGARFALGALADAAGVTLTVQRVEGRLCDRLTLTGLRVAQPKLATRVARLELAWDPALLWSGEIRVNELALSGVEIRDDSPPTGKPPELSWPKLSGALRRLELKLQRFELSRFSYRRLSQAPVELDELTARLSLVRGLFTASRLKVVSPGGRLSGEVAAGFAYPSLKLDLLAVPARPLEGMELFSLQARLTPGRGKEQLSGGIALAGRQGGSQRLTLSAELGLAGNLCSLRRLRLDRPGRKGEVTGAGSVLLTAGEPLLALSLRAADIDLARELHRPITLDGTLTFQGALSRYRGDLALTSKGAGALSATIAAQYHGGTTGVKLVPLSGKALDGTLAGALSVDWSPALAVHGKLSGRGLDPGRLAADWRGVVNLDLAGSLELPSWGAPTGEVTGRLLQSRLHGQELKGEVAASFAGGELRVKRLNLTGRGFELDAAGELAQRLNLNARVSDLSRLLPGTAGRLTAGGWLRWHEGLFSAALAGEGSGLAADGMRAREVSFDAGLGEGKDHPLRLEASLHGVRLGRGEVERAALSLRGSAASHALTAELASAGSSARATLSGGYQGGVWQGSILSLNGSDRVGPWRLAAPAMLSLGAGHGRLTPLIIDGVGGERLEAAGEWRREPAAGSIRLFWNDLNLARADGWLAGIAAGGTSSGHADLSLAGARVKLMAHGEARGSVTVDGARLNLAHLAADLTGDAGGWRGTASLELAGGEGGAQLVFTSTSPASLALPKTGELGATLAGLDLALIRPLLPRELLLTGRLAGTADGRIKAGVLELRGHTALSGGNLNWRRQGAVLDATLSTAELAFQWRGSKAGHGRLQVNARAEAAGAYTANGRRIQASRASLRLDADRQGTRGAAELVLEGGGKLRAALTSNAPGLFPLPETAGLSLAWGGLTPSLLQPWLPGPLDLKGELAGNASGRLLPGGRVELAGEATFSQGEARWQETAGELRAGLRSGRLTFDWRGERLSGALDLSLADYGRGEGRFSLPIPARLPVAPVAQGALTGSLTAKLKEHGLLAVALPGLLQESHGELSADLRLAGVWSAPQLTGNLSLAGAGGYLPSAGITLRDLQFTARLENDLVRIDDFRALSGDGQLRGWLLARLSGGRVTSYSGSLNGEAFQTVYLPELQLATSPRLDFRGEGEKLTIQGELHVPQMLVAGPPARPVVTASGDVILEGAPPAEKRPSFPLAVTGQLHVTLGDRVEVKASGIDATLGGEMELTLNGIDSITSSGEIRVLKGRYRAYGMDLDVVRGRLYYVHDPVDQPTLDILALRTVDDVKAGVTVAGHLNAPVVKLYSEPSMAEVDVLAYMVLGHPLGASTEQGSMLASAASSLFSFGQSASLEEQIKERLGLSVLGVQTVTPGSAGLMGYKEVSVTPSGAPSKQTAGQSLVTVGKYLTPKLYLSYGRSVISGASLFMLRYDVLRHWQLETQSGAESGLDVYYKVQFD